MARAFKNQSKVITKDFDEGGLKMMDINAFMKSLKLSWIRKVIQGQNKFTSLARKLIDFNILCNTGSLYAISAVKNITNAFWIDVLTIYSDFVKSINIDSVDKLVDMPLFFNNCLLINNKYIFWKYWYDDGIRFVKDIIKDSGQILSLQELQAKMNKPVNFLHYEGIKKVLSTYIVSVQNVKLKDYKVHSYPILSTYIKPIILNSCNKLLYNMLKENSEIPTCQTKWNEYFADDSIQWKNVHGQVFKKTNNTYIQWLQTRIIHRILGTNSLLFKMGLSDSKTCTFCKMSEESITHLFWDCNTVKILIKDISDSLKNANIQIVINSKMFLLGDTNVNDNCFILFMEVKKYIFECKRKEVIPHFQGFKASLKLSLNIYENTTNESNKGFFWIVIRLICNS